VTSLANWLISFFRWAGELGLFASRACRELFRPPFEFGETADQIYDAGLRSTPLIIACGFAFGVVLSMQTRSSMEAFGAESMVPQAISFGMFKDIGAVVTTLLVAGRVGAGIGAQLAGMRVTEQIDALEALAVDSFKYLVVTRITACVIALPVLTTLFDFSGVVGGMISEMIVPGGIPPSLYWRDAFAPMGWSDYIPSILKTVVFGFIVGTVSCYLGYTATEGATGVGRASTKSVVYSSLLVILSDVILVKLIFFWFPG
jgi:phospholipid/cholesterol/gamma-HCH transport system permease protein